MIFLLLLFAQNWKFIHSLKQIKLGVPIPWSGKSWDAGPRFAAGITVAVERINRDPTLLPGYNVSFVWGDSQCEEKPSLGVIARMLSAKPPVNVIIGPACSDGCRSGSFLTDNQNIPMVSYGCAASFLSDSTKFPNFARTVGVYSKSGRIFVNLMRQYNWDRIAILTPTSGLWSSIMNGVRADIEAEKNLHVSYFQNFIKDSVSDAFLRRILRDAVSKAHIFLLGGYRNTIIKIMRQAKEIGLTSPGYVFICYELLIDICAKPSLNQTLEEKESCELLEGLLDISLFVPQNEEYENFSKLVRQKMAQPPFNRVMPKEEPVEIYAAFLHDAALLYAHALNKTLIMNGSIHDGRLIVHNMLNYTFQGASGNVTIDQVGDRASALVLKNIQNGKYKRTANFFVSRNYLQVLNTTVIWPGKTTAIPIGRPTCGFNREFCPPPEPTPWWVYVIAGVLSFLVLASAVAFFMVHYRRKLFEQSLMSQTWRVKFNDVQFNGKRNNRLTGSKTPQTKRTQNALLSIMPLLQTQSHGSTQSIDSVANDTQVFTRIGLFQGNYVAIKQLFKSSIQLTRELLVELKEVSELQHQNVNLFIGACVDSPNICILTQYCNKGSLQDVLFNDDIKLDWMFQISVASDIARGMLYLHNNTMIGVHGRLKSTNCVIDSRWTCKVTDIGLFKFKEGQLIDEEVGIDHEYNNLLWTAPEHIDNIKCPHSKEGDVYSYGIILQEIITRGTPYAMFEHLTAKEIISRVKKCSLPRFRPKVPEDYGHPEYHSLMKQCWEEVPSSRPRFDEIMKALKKLNGGKNINIVDNMIKMMEKYTDHLEEIVAERTKQLEEEKAKTDELLYRMLPRTVAEQLKQGETVQAETFDMVTIFFSDIVGFTKLAAESTPMQVVDLLNDLYTCFDQIVDQHHVYKVETIGDAYMVVSGLPQRNGNRHAGEIARMSLDLLSATTTFKVRHKMEYRLQLRIGIHSGSCVAGVVGLKMPRYCLFGDTVNYASRMESSGLALRIHVSPECCRVLNELGGYHLVERGPVAMKGKGTIVTYFLAGYDGFTKTLPDLAYAARLEEHSFK